VELDALTGSDAIANRDRPNSWIDAQQIADEKVSVTQLLLKLISRNPNK
jgi:hypothetical protein